MYVGISKKIIPTRRNPHIQNNNEEQIYILDSGHSCVPLEKLMAIDMLNINCSLVVAEISRAPNEPAGTRRFAPKSGSQHARGTHFLAHVPFFAKNWVPAGSFGALERVAVHAKSDIVIINMKFLIF